MKYLTLLLFLLPFSLSFAQSPFAAEVHLNGTLMESSSPLSFNSTSNTFPFLGFHIGGHKLFPLSEKIKLRVPLLFEKNVIIKKMLFTGRNGSATGELSKTFQKNYLTSGIGLHWQPVKWYAFAPVIEANYLLSTTYRIIGFQVNSVEINKRFNAQYYKKVNLSLAIQHQFLLGKQRRWGFILFAKWKLLNTLKSHPDSKLKELERSDGVGVFRYF